MSGLLTKAEEIAIALGARCVLPSRSVLKGHPVNLYDTNVAERFKAFRAAQQPASPNVCPITKKARKA